MNHFVKGLSALPSRFVFHANHYKYKNLTLLALTITLTFSLSRFEAYHQFLLGLGQLEYLGAFVAGAAFVSTFTAAPGALTLLILTQNLPLLPLGVAAGAGAMVCDLLVFKFVRDGLAGEVENIYEQFGGRHLNHLLHTKYFHWTLPVIGALLIASPLPDEIGVSLMGISRMKTKHFMVVSFLLNTLGIITVLAVSRLIKP